MIVIDQGRIDAPKFPRSAEWWREFVPEWAAVTVHDDGKVTLEPSGLTMRYTAERGIWWEPVAGWSAAKRQRAEQSIARWIRSLPRLAVAIVGEN